MQQMRNLRNILFKAFLINIFFVLVIWGFAMANLMEYFMWALPGLTLESANEFVIIIAGIIDVFGLIFFLVPCLAISWQISRYKKTWEYEVERILESGGDDDDLMFSVTKPAKSKSKAKKAKKSTKKKKR